MTTPADLLASAPGADWRPLDPERVLYVDPPSGRAVIELNPEFAPASVANITTLVRERYFDGLAIVRAQDNHVVQCGDLSENRSLGTARTSIPPEFTRHIGSSRFTALPDMDTYAPETGFIEGFPVARDPAEDMEWLIHSYGMVGVGRGEDPATGNGTVLYVVIGHAPRHLDRNATLVGRVVVGMELISVMPRGSGTLGFYTGFEHRPQIRGVRLGVDTPVAERPALELLRTDSASFARWIDARRTRREPWFLVPGGRIDVGSIPIPVRSRVVSGEIAAIRGQL